MGNKIFYVIITILIIGILIIAALFFINYFDLKKDSQENVETYIYDIPDSFITNLLESERYIKVKLSIQVTDKKLLDQLKEQDAKIKHNIIYILRNKKEEDIKKGDAQSMLKQEVLDKLNQVLKTDKITDIYFSEFVLQ